MSDKYKILDAALTMDQERRKQESIKSYKKFIIDATAQNITPEILVNLIGSNLQILFESLGPIIHYEKESRYENTYFFFVNYNIYINAIIVKDSFREKITNQYFELVNIIAKDQVIFTEVK